MKRLHVANESLIEWEDPNSVDFTMIGKNSGAPLTPEQKKTILKIGIGVLSDTIYVVRRLQHGDPVGYAASTYLPNGNHYINLKTGADLYDTYFSTQEKAQAACEKEETTFKPLPNAI